MLLRVGERELMKKGAKLTKCGRYRYGLYRIWDIRKPLMCWAMLNPSKADHRQNDPTITRCINFSSGWGYGGFYVVNLFAYRSKLPTDLLRVSDPVGPRTRQHTLGIISHIWQTWFHSKTQKGPKPILLAGWGNSASKVNDFQRERQFLLYTASHNYLSVRCLGINKGGEPKHPLYCPDDSELLDFC